MNRRTFLTIGSAGFATEALGAGYGHGNKEKAQQNNKAVIMVFLGGGPTHIEMFHADPRMPEGIKAINGEIQTSIPDFYIGADWTNLAKYADHLNFVKNYGHTNNNHQNAVYWQLAGRPQNQTFQTEPSLGAITARIMGPNNPYNGLPVYMATSKMEGDGGAWLGSIYKPFEANERGARDLTMGLPYDRMAQRLNMIRAIDSSKKSYPSQAWNDSYKLREQAFEMILGDVKKVFEVKHEPESVRKLYGENEVGNSLLLARRLVESGCKFILVNHGGWDMHTNISAGLKNRVPNLDFALAGLIQDLEARGMDEVMIVMTGDFGRTVRVTQNLGRDHHANLCSLMIYDKNSKGKVIGKCDNFAAGPDGDKYEPKDLARTMLEHLGINPRGQVTDNASRPRWLVDDGARNILT